MTNVLPFPINAELRRRDLLNAIENETDRTAKLLLISAFEAIVRDEGRDVGLQEGIHRTREAMRQGFREASDQS